jgi:DMSO reductase anchor subunit
MTTLIQAVAGSLVLALLFHGVHSLLLSGLLLITSLALNISIFHLGRPAYAWRALKMWRRSWLSREVLLFGLFFGALATFTLTTWALMPSLAALLNSSWLQHLQTLPLAIPTVKALGWTAAILAIAGTIASACIYLVPARPAWNMIHTPIDFLLSGTLIGSTLPLCLDWIAQHLSQHALVTAYPVWPTILAATLWITNQATRLVRLNSSSTFEERATAALLNTPDQRGPLILCFGLVAASALFALAGAFAYSCLAAFAGVLLARYLFFVSVVPLNMALTFTRGGSH